MVLLVVGLVVIVLVILVVVFLSVRSMRADEGDGYPARGPEARRQPAGARSARTAPAGGRTAAARDYGGARTYRDDAPDPRDQDHGPARRRGGPAADQARRDQTRSDRTRSDGARPDRTRADRTRADRTRADRTRAGRAGADRPAADQAEGAAAQRRFGALPRPRGHQHDEEFDSRDWGGVSDEQYWAELSADKPLATTARSAGPGNDPRPAPRARRDSAAPPAAREPAPTMAAAGVPTTQFSLRSESGLPGGRPASPEHWTDPGAGGPETDPTIGGPGGWQEPAADTSPTAAWAAPGTDMPGTDLPGTGDLSGWDRADDPLTSASFPAPGAHSTGTASYLDQHGSGYESSWDSPGTPGRYEGSADDWRGADHEYPAGLEPSGTAAGWYPAPTPGPGYSPAPEPAYSRPPEPGYSPAESWDSGLAGGYPARDDLSAGHAADSSRYDWDRPGQHEPGHASPGYQAGHRADIGEPSGYGSAGSGYDLPDPLGGSDGDPSGYHPAGTGYQLPDYGSASGGYHADDSGYHADRSGYHGDGGGYHGDGGGYPTDGHDAADGGYQHGYDRPASGYEVPDTAPHQAGYGPAGNGYDLSGHGPAGNGYDLPVHSPAGNGYGLQDHQGYELPGHDPAAGYLPNGHDPVGYRAGHDRDGGYRPPDHGTGNGYFSR